MKRRKNKQYTAIGAYVSAGGFSAGISRHLNIVAHLSDGEFGVETLEHNFPDVPHFHPYEDWPYDRLAAMDPDLFYAAPPCAPWSRSGGRGKKITEDPRVEKVSHIIEAGLAVQPRMWVMESVPQMPEWTPEFTLMIQNAWLEKGYSVTHFYSNYLLHDTPQNRPRYHFIAHKDQLTFPDFSTSAVTLRDVVDPNSVPSEDDLIDSKDLDRYGWLLPYTPPGARLRGAYRHLAGKRPGSESKNGKIGGPPYMLAVLRWDAPCLTLVSVPKRFHPDGQRLLTLSEGMAVCGFNGYPEFEFVGDTTEDKFKQIAKGVLPTLGDYLGAMAVQSFRNNVPIQEPHVETVDFRPFAQRIMRRIPKRKPFDPKLFGKFPHFQEPEHKPWMGPNHPSDYLDAYVEDEYDAAELEDEDDAA